MPDSKKCIIRFSSDSVTVLNKSLEQRIEEEVSKIIVQGVKDITEDKARIMLKGQILSKRQTEKNALQDMLVASMKDIKLLADQNIITDMSSIIVNSEDHVIFYKADVEKFLRDGFKKATKQSWWAHLGELFKQIDKPEEVKENAV